MSLWSIFQNSVLDKHILTGIVTEIGRLLCRLCNLQRAPAFPVGLICMDKTQVREVWKLGKGAQDPSGCTSGFASSSRPPLFYLALVTWVTSADRVNCQSYCFF